MKLSIMQPYFFPYPGYFSLIEAVDKFVFLDEVQYIRHGWINRNRILNYDGNNWIYIGVPLVKHKRDTPINKIKISNSIDWKSKILSQLNQYKNKAPYFNETISIVKEVIETNFDSISELNIKSIKEICSYLNIVTNFRNYENYSLNHGAIINPGDWAYEISKTLNATEYINPIGGKDLFDNKKFNNAGIKLKFQKQENIKYNQLNTQFISNLSIIDMMMFNSSSEISLLIKTHKKI